MRIDFNNIGFTLSINTMGKSFEVTALFDEAHKANLHLAKNLDEGVIDVDREDRIWIAKLEARKGNFPSL